MSGGAASIRTNLCIGECDMKFGEQVFDPTDPQQFRVYAAERATPFGRGAHFESLAEMRGEIARIMDTPIWRALSAHTLQDGREVELRKGRGRAGKAYVFVSDTPRIIMPPHRWHRWTLIHELAHCVRGCLTCTHGPQLRERFERERVRVAPWWEPGAPIPAPDPARLALRLDDGAEEEMAAYRAAAREAWLEAGLAARRYLASRGISLD